MRTITFFLQIWLLFLFIDSACGFSSHNTEITRTFDQTEAALDSYITVKVNFKNNEIKDLRGFYYTEQIPEGLSVNTKSVKINSQEIADYIVESNGKHAVYTGYIPFRWILEEPPLFEKNNPITASANLEIIYTISSSHSGSYYLDQFSWAGYYQNLQEYQRVAFGYNDNQDKQAIMFGKDNIEAVDDNYTLEEGGTLIQSNPGGVLTNDINTDGSSLAVLLDNDVSCGMLSLNADGSFAYSHDGSETENDSFTYHTTTGNANSNIATATFNITAVNDPPIANNDSIKTLPETPVTINVLQNDTDIDGRIDPSTVEIIDTPSSGTAEANMDGKVTYSPTADVEGTNSFTYTVRDDLGILSNEATVSIIINNNTESSGGGCFINFYSY